MRVRVLLGGLVVAAAVGGATPASACMVLAPMDADGHGPSAREIRAQMDSELRARLRRRSAVVQAALASGVDPVAELAAMLIPNIRAIPVEETDCGPVREYDGGFDRLQAEDYLAGTYLHGYGNEFGWMLLHYEGELFGPACNEEFRARFAAYLRGRLDDGPIRAAYLFLGARWGGREPSLFRMMRFQDWHLRRPPVEWSNSYTRDILRWVQRTEEGQALQRVIDDFWRENGALPADQVLACPVAAARWPAMQARLVAEIERQNPDLTAQIRRVRLRQAPR